MNRFIFKIKQFFFTGLLALIKALRVVKTPFKRFFYLLFKPLFWIIKLFIRYLLLPLYQQIRKIKKGVFIIPGFLKNHLLNLAWHNRSWIILIIICSIIFASNLQAEIIKPENYGQKSLLNKISQGGEAFSLTLDEGLEEEEVKEGPLDKNVAPRSYLQQEAMTSPEVEPQKANEGIDTLISTTGDGSALISPEITDTQIVTQKRDKIVEYQVQPGDTISTIAAKFSLKSTTLLWENNLSYYSYIKPGQILRILPADGLSYKIKKGDTLGKIAKNYKLDEEKIIEFNKLASAADIQIGQQIILPGAAKPEVIAPARSYSIKDIFSPSAAVSSSKLQWPTNSYRMTQYYTWRHHGVDIANKTGQPIYAAESGVVLRAGWDRSGYGYMITINHGNGLITLYAHASKLFVKVGDQVNRGQVIAAIGSTGRSTGPHLHFEVKINNSRVNPLGYVR